MRKDGQKSSPTMKEQLLFTNRKYTLSHLLPEEHNK